MRTAKLSNNNARLSEGFEDFAKDLTDFMPEDVPEDVDSIKMYVTAARKRAIDRAKYSRGYVIDLTNPSHQDAFLKELEYQESPLEKLIERYGESTLQSWFDSYG